MFASLVMLGAALACVLPACEESLPPRDVPREFLSASMVTDTSLIVIHLREDHPPPIVTQPWAIRGEVRNITDEVIQDSADVHITVTLTTRTTPPFTTVVRGTGSNLVGFVQVTNGLLLIDTRYPAAFRILWSDWRWSDGRGIWTPWRQELHMGVDGNGKNFDQTNVIPLDVTASIQLFRHTSPVKWAGVLYLVMRIYPV